MTRAIYTAFATIVLAPFIYEIIIQIYHNQLVALLLAVAVAISGLFALFKSVT